MTISLIAATTKAGVIGHHGNMPWHMPADLKRFKALTMGKAVIMGRKTYQSIGKPLPGRHIIIVTRNTDYRATGCTICFSLEDAIRQAHALNVDPEIMIAGGGELYAQSIGIADYLYLTQIDASLAGDTYFPRFQENEWKEIMRDAHQADAHHIYDYTFLTLQRR